MIYIYIYTITNSPTTIKLKPENQQQSCLKTKPNDAYVGNKPEKIVSYQHSEMCCLPALSSVETSQAQFACDKPHFYSYSVFSQMLALVHSFPSKPENYNAMVIKRETITK